MGTAAFYNDGSVPYGARTEVVKRGATYSGGTTVGTFIFESITLDRNDKAIKQYDELGAPLKSAGVFDFDEGTATVQVVTNGTLLQRGDLFQDTFDSVTGAETFVIFKVGEPETQNDYKKLTVSFRKKYASS